MSDTDKDDPYWVQNYYIGAINHDHRAGQCRVETLADARQANTSRARYYSRHLDDCTRRVTETTWCSRHDRDRFCYLWVFDGYDGDCRVYWWKTCEGHTRTFLDHTLPCTCPPLPVRPTCTVAWRLHFRWFVSTNPPKEWMQAVVYGPARRAVRDTLRDEARAWNAGADVDEDRIASVGIEWRERMPYWD